MIKEAPIEFLPILKSMIWGGDKICHYKGLKQLQPNVGESWEISQIPGSVSVVARGEYAGLSVDDLISLFGESLLGKKVFQRYRGKFPLLIKFIDAKDNLSVQVHPNDELAEKRHGARGKTEMWYIVEAEKNAKIFTGFKQKITPEEYTERVTDGTFASAVAQYPSRPGDVFFLPPGRVHAIGAGNFLAEIQVSSDITYRIYDYGRLDTNGLPRQLHTELAKDAIDFNVCDSYRSPAPKSGENVAEVLECEHFKVKKIEIDQDSVNGLQLDLHDDSFTILVGLKGKADISCKDGSATLKAGHSLLIPACVSRLSLVGDASLLAVNV